VDERKRNRQEYTTLIRLLRRHLPPQTCGEGKEKTIIKLTYKFYIKRRLQVCLIAILITILALLKILVLKISVLQRYASIC
jgi:hypothetical protein